MTKLEVTDLIKNEALIHSNQRMHFEYDRFRLSDEKRKSMILIGTIGQLMFKKYLEDNDIVFDFQLQAGQYDDLDFKIDDDIIEIKTSGFEDTFLKLNLLYSSDQYNDGMEKGFRYCVQLFINGYSRVTKLLDINNCNECYIAGYIHFEDIEKYPHERQHYGDDYKVPLNNLIDITELIRKYKK